MSTLWDRCKDMVESLRLPGAKVDDLVDFVVSEVGRTADPALDEALPLCLYFTTLQDRDEFIAAVRDAKPGMTTRKVGP